MALPFFNGSSKKKRNQVIAVDLGARTTKAVLMERRGDVLALLRYALADAPIYGKKFTPDALSAHLRELVAALETSTKSAALSIGNDESIVRQVELPQIPAEPDAWLEPLGVASLIGEASFVAVFVAKR